MAVRSVRSFVAPADVGRSDKGLGVDRFVRDPEEFTSFNHPADSLIIDADDDDLAVAQEAPFDRISERQSIEHRTVCLGPFPKRFG